MRNTWIITLSCLLIAMASCETDTEEVFDPGYLYFPMNQGTYVDYHVDSIIWDTPVNRLDSFQYYIRERIDSTWREDSGRLSARVERLYKQNLDDDWVIKDIWEQNRDEMKAEKVEENVRYVKLGFPVAEGETWDGHAANTLEERMYSYADIAQALVVNDSTYENTVRVMQIDESNLVERIFGEEVYAYGVGMISKDRVELQIDFNTAEIDTGLEYYMRAIGHGRD